MENWNQRCVFGVWWVSPEWASLCFDSLNRNSGALLALRFQPTNCHIRPNRPRFPLRIAEHYYKSKIFPLVQQTSSSPTHSPLKLFPVFHYQPARPIQSLFVGTRNIRCVRGFAINCNHFPSVLRLATARSRRDPQLDIYLVQLRDIWGITWELCSIYLDKLRGGATIVSR